MAMLASVANNFLLDDCRTLLSSDEAAVYLKIAKSTLYKHTSAGRISYFKPSGKLLLFRKQDLDKWIHRGHVPSNDELLE